MKWSIALGVSIFILLGWIQFQFPVSPAESREKSLVATSVRSLKHELPPAKPRPPAPVELLETSDEQEAYKQTISALVDLQDWRGALQQLHRRLETHPKDTWALNWTGMILKSKLNDLSAALPYFERSVWVNPDDDFVVRRIFEIADRTQQFRRARTYLEKVNHESPGQASIQFYLGEITLREDTQAGLRLLSESARDSRFYGRAIDLIARTHLRQGEFQKARARYQESVEYHELVLAEEVENGKSLPLLETRLAQDRLSLATLLPESERAKAIALWEAAEKSLGSDNPTVERVREHLGM